jgi:hypothetical protein
MRQQQVAGPSKPTLPFETTTNETGHDNGTDNNKETQQRNTPKTERTTHLHLYYYIETVSYFSLASFFVMLSHACSDTAIATTNTSLASFFVMLSHACSDTAIATTNTQSACMYIS